MEWKKEWSIIERLEWDGNGSKVELNGRGSGVEWNDEWRGRKQKEEGEVIGKYKCLMCVYDLESCHRKKSKQNQ